MARPKMILGETEVEDSRCAPPWQRTHGQYLSGHAAIDEVDKLAVECERRWGAGRLRLLVSADLRTKFDRQRYLFNRAVWHGQLEDVERESKRMCAAWRALVAAVERDGLEPHPPEVWEVVLADGSVAAIVRDEQDASRINTEGRGLAIYTLAEVGCLLSGFPALAKAKEVFDGASVVEVRMRGDPLDGIDDTRPELNDVIPF